MADADTTDVVVFLETGNMLVNEELVGKGLSDARLKQIELYLSAHFACVALEKGGLTREKVGESEAMYRMERPSRYNLSLTRYGQQALVLDPTGSLSALDSPGGKAEFRVVAAPKATFPPFNGFFP